MSAGPDLETIREHLVALEGDARAAVGQPSSLRSAGEAGHAVLEIDGELLSVPLARVEVLLRAAEVVPVPGAAPGVLGAVCHGSRMVAVLDGAGGTRATTAAPTSGTVALLRVASGSVGLAVDAVHGVSDTARAPRALDLDALAP